MENLYLKQTVFPSEEKTIIVANDEDYGGAHRYSFIGSKGFKDGKAEYDFENIQTIQFVQKNIDGGVMGDLKK